jgi:hypothetical protein
MADKTYKYVLDFQGKTDKLLKDVTGIEGQLKKAQSAASALFTAAAITAATTAIIEFGKQSVAAYDEAAQNETALLVALKGRADVQSRLLDQATDLSRKTLFEDDEIIRSQSLVAAFVKEEESIKRLLPAIMDFASAKRMDLAGASDLVTKTLAGEMNALGRYGIQISGAAGSADRLEQIILSLNHAYGGQAEAAAKEGAAGLKMLSKEYDNLKESVGKLILAQSEQSGSLTEIITNATIGLSDFVGKMATLSNAGMGLKESLFGAFMVDDEEIKKLDTAIRQKSQAELAAKAKVEQAEFEAMEKKRKAAEEYAELQKEKANEQKKAWEDFNKEIERGLELARDISNESAVDFQSMAADMKAGMDEALSAKSNDNPLDFYFGPLDEMTKKLDSLKSKQSSALSPEQWKTYQAEIDATQIKIDEFTGAAAWDQLQDKAQLVSDAVAGGFQQIGNSIIESLGLAEDGFDGFIAGLMSTAVELISMMLAQSIANAIAGATASGTATGPAAIFTTPAFIATAVGGVLAAFAAIPKLADGGMAYGPTMAMIGEYPGASSNPEIIAPLSKLKEVIEPGGASGFALMPSLAYDGDQLRIFLNRVEKNAYKRT